MRLSLLLVPGLALCLAGVLLRSGSPLHTEALSPTADAASRLLSAGAVSYRIQARLRPEQKEVQGRLHLALRNVSRAPLQKACLHLYLNAFARPDTLFLRESRGTMRLSRFDPARPGSVELRDLRQQVAEGQARRPRPATWRLLHDGTVLEADLAEPVAPGAELELAMRFRSKLPRVFARTGFAGDFFMVAQWYPKPGVLRSDGTWHCPPFAARAEFFADFGRFDVELKVPAQYRVGASGMLVAEQQRAGLRRLSFRAVDVHDFAWTAWPHFDQRRRSTGDVEIELLTVPGRGQSDRTLARLADTLDRLQRWLGPYPYRQLTAVVVPTAALGAGGMEYPTLLTLWMPWFAPPWLRAFDETAVHELVHQYFQGMVASNEVEEPWLDEAVTSYVTALIMEQLFGEDRSFLDLGLLRLSLLDKERLRIAGPSARALPVGWPARRFSSWWEYGRTVYARGSLLLHTVESLIGRQAMREALRAYVRAFSFRHPASADLERALLDRAAPQQRGLLADLLDGVLRRGHDLDYALSCGPDEVRVLRRGELALPLELSVRGSAGEQRLALDGRAREQRVLVPGLRRAVLGPRRRLALDHTPADLACRVSRFPGRTALGWALVLEPLLQVLGP
jgi:hypothetical protein